MQQFELTHEFLSQLEEQIDAGNKTEVSKQIAGLHPADIAEILEELNNERAQFVFLLLDNEKAGDVLAEIDEEERVHFIAVILIISRAAYYRFGVERLYIVASEFPRLKEILPAGIIKIIVAAVFI